MTPSELYRKIGSFIRLNQHPQEQSIAAIEQYLLLSLAADREALAKQCDERAVGYERNRIATVVNPAFWAAKRNEAEDIAALIRGGKT